MFSTQLSSQISTVSEPAIRRAKAEGLIVPVLHGSGHGQAHQFDEMTVFGMFVSQIARRHCGLDDDAAWELTGWIGRLAKDEMIESFRKGKTGIGVVFGQAATPALISRSSVEDMSEERVLRAQSVGIRPMFLDLELFWENFEENVSRVMAFQKIRRRKSGTGAIAD